MSLRPALSLFLLALLSASLSGLPDAGYASIPGRRPRNVVLSSHDLTALTTSLGSSTVIQMKRTPSTWVRTEIPVAGKSWGICLLDLETQFGTMEVALVTLPYQEKIQLLLRFGTGDFGAFGTFDVPAGCTEILADPQNQRCFAANRGAPPDDAWAEEGDVEAWQHAVYELSVGDILSGGSVAVTRAFVTDREPRALELSPDGRMLYVGHVQGALGGLPNDATDGIPGETLPDGGIPDAGSNISAPAYDGGSIIAFDLDTPEGVPAFRVAVGSPVRGLAVLDLDSTYRVYYTHLGYGAQAEDPDFGGDDIPNLIGSFAVDKATHVPVAGSGQNALVAHEPEHTTGAAAVLPEKLAVRKNEFELWVTNSGSGSVTRIGLDATTGAILTSGPMPFTFRTIDPVDTRTPEGWILNTKVPVVTESYDVVADATTVPVNRNAGDDSSNPRGILATENRILVATQFDAQLVEIDPNTDPLPVQNFNLTSDTAVGVGEDERDFFTFGRGFAFRESGAQPFNQTLELQVDNITCGSCHVDGHIDGKVRLIVNDQRNRVTSQQPIDASGLILPEASSPDQVQRGKPVQVPTVFDVGRTEWLFHEGRKTIRDREEAGTIDCAYCQETGFFPDTKQFTNGLKSPPSPFAVGGRLNQDQLRGRFLFEAMNCSRCHGGPTGVLFPRTDPNLNDLPGTQPDNGPMPHPLRKFNNLLHDASQVFIGFSADLEGNRNMSNVGTRIPNEARGDGINTPALAGAWDNRPYLHDGRYRTLDEVLRNSWLLVGEGFRAARFDPGVIPDNAYDDPNGLPATLAELIAYDEPHDLHEFNIHRQFVQEPDPQVRMRVTDYLASIQGTEYPAGEVPEDDLLAFLRAVSSQTILCGSEGDGASLFSNVIVTPEAGQMRLSWDSAVPVACEVTWGLTCDPTTVEPPTPRGIHHSVLLDAASGVYKAEIAARMRTVCPDPATIEVTWGSDDPVGTVTADATATLCPVGDEGSLVLQIDLDDALFSTSVAADRFSLCARNEGGAILYGAIQADAPADPPSFTTTMTLPEGAGCDPDHPFLILLDGTQFVGSATAALKSPDTVYPLGIVDRLDFEAFAANYPPAPFDACFDLETDGVMDILDLTLFANHLNHAVSGITGAAAAAPASARLTGLERTDPEGGTEIVLRGESMGLATSILAVLEVPEGAAWTPGAGTPNLAGGRTESGEILVAAWGLRGLEEVDLGMIRLPAGGLESVRLSGGRVLEGGVTGVLSGIEKRVPGPEGFALGRSLPNPFRAATTITFTLDEESDVSLEVFDLRGRLVRSLVHSRLPAAEHEAVWDGRDSGGSPVSAGLYFYRLSNGRASTTRKVVLLD